MAAHLYQLSVNAEHQPLSAINQRRLANARPIDALIRLLSDAYIHDSDPLHKRMARRIKDGFDVFPRTEFGNSGGAAGGR